MTPFANVESIEQPFASLSQAATVSAARVALVSPGSVLAPLDTEARSEQLQRRIQLIALLYLVMDGFFLVAGNLHRALFLSPRGGAGAFVGNAIAIHVLVLLLELAVWLAPRRRSLRGWALVLLDAGLIVGVLGGHALQATRMVVAPHYQIDLIMNLVTNCVLVSRAAIVPSRPRTTLIVSTLGVLPVLAVAAWAGARRGALPETVSFDAIWCAAGIGLTACTSRVIYGLRESVAIAQQFGRYIVERKLGEGGMGEVYLARHTLLRRPTAVKLLPPDRAGAKAIARFEREVRETSRLSHPNTVAIYDYGRTRDGIFYYAMEYLDGLDLQRLVERAGPFPPSRVVHVLAQVIGALSEAHSRGLVHRDMKPANVILCERGGLLDTAKVLDFGLVKDLLGASGNPNQTEINAVIGTPAYMSPEAITSPEQVDARADLYAVGAIAYFLLTGHTVYSGNSFVALCLAHLQETPVPPSRRLGRELPPDLEALVLRCLEKEPSARPASAAELRSALLACAVPSWTPADAERFWGAFSAARGSHAELA